MLSMKSNDKNGGQSKSNPAPFNNGPKEDSHNLFKQNNLENTFKQMASGVENKSISSKHFNEFS